MSLHSLLRFVPKNHLSTVVGWFAHRNLPNQLASWTVKKFAERYGARLDEASKPIEAYKSVGDFFVRDLKPGVRPIQKGVVSPVDGTLRSIGRIENLFLEQIKGKYYSLFDLLQDRDMVGRFREGSYFSFYLAPGDYHHIHSPVSGRIFKSQRIPGRLWPVNAWAIENIRGLFCQNERAITYIQTEEGAAAVVKVAALNVGGIDLTYDLEEVVSCGHRIGTFRMGSAVLLVFEKTFNARIDSARQPGPVRYGETLFS